MTQWSTSEIGDAPLYNSCTLPIQGMTTEPLPAPSKCKPRLPRITGTRPGWWKQNFRLRFMVFGVVSSEGHIRPTSHLRSRLKSQHQKCTWMCWRVWWSSGVIRWPAADPRCGSRTRRRPTSPKTPRLGFRRSATTLSPSLTGPTPLPTWTRWTTSFGHTLRTSPTWPPKTPKAQSDQRHPTSIRRVPAGSWGKGHAPSSGSVSRRWLRLKVAILNGCQFSIKTFKIKL